MIRVDALFIMVMSWLKTLASLIASWIILLFPLGRAMHIAIFSGTKGGLYKLARRQRNIFIICGGNFLNPPIVKS